MLITSSIPNLINGISQQPATLRLASQAEEQTNFLSSVTDGLKRRPGTRHLAKLNDTPWDDAFLHTINRDSNEKYLVVIRGGDIKVFNAKTGVAQVVNSPLGRSYLNGGVKNTFRAVTVADYTFILNRYMIARMDPILSPTRSNMAIINVRAGNYGKAYTIFINGVPRGKMYTTQGDVADQSQGIRTDTIAASLAASLAGAPVFTHYTYNPPFVQGAGDFSSFGYWAEGDTVIINSSSSVPFTVRMDDGTGGTSIVAISSRVQRFSDLPKFAPNGYSVEIVGDNTSAFDNYFMKFAAQGSTGVWEESLKGGETYRLNPATMPHVLIREADGTFTFRPGDWVDRKVGDKDSIPDASFVNRKISDIFFYRNRLGMLADENVILSKQGEFFDFYRDTATTLLDTDPLDLAVSNSKVSILNHALPFNKSLLLFSEGAQFILDSGDILSAETAYVTQSTEFESAANVRPVGVGQFVYFPVARGSFTGVREYFVQAGNEQNDALDVTSHCPRYLPKNLFKLAASTSEDIILGVSSDIPNALWVYKFFFGEEGKLQSAWSRWTFPTDTRILSADFIDTAAYLTIARDDGTYIERLDVESGARDVNASHHYHVDRGLFLTGGTYNGTHTTFTLPYATTQPLWVFFGAGDAESPEGLVLHHDRPSSTTVRVSGDRRGRVIFAGLKYLSTYTFSTFFLRSNEAGGGVSAVDDGRLQVRRLSINFNETGYFKVTSTPRGRPSSFREYTGKLIADGSATLGTSSLSEGRFNVPILCRNKDANIVISSDSFLPCSFTSAEWEATYHTRAKRL